jgi:hypothetical protein
MRAILHLFGPVQKGFQLIEYLATKAGAHQVAVVPDSAEVDLGLLCVAVDTDQ